MIKRFLVAAILGLLLMSSQIVAAYDYNWDTVQRVSSKSDLATYIESQKRAGQSTIPVILTNGLTVELNDFINLCPSSVVSQKIIYDDGQNIRVIYTLMDYPGTKVANAYLSGNTIWLTAEEKRLYDEAVKIVNEAKKLTIMINQELYIYEQIMNRSQYLTGDMSNQQRFVTAIGVLLDGKANCQGYADAFYMLGRMMGWNVGRMSGTAGGGAHAWNTITFDDGKTYFIDTTWDDNAIGFGGWRNFNDYKYFNAPAEIMQVTHSWDRALEPQNIQPSVDGRYGYFNTTHTRRVSSAEAGFKLINEKLSKEKFKWFAVIVPFDKKYYDINQAIKKVNAGTYLFRTKCGKYLFFFAAMR